MRRKLFTLLATVSALLFAATIFTWVWSRVAVPPDFFVVQSAETSYGLGTEQGAVIGFLQRERPWYHDPDPADVQFVRAGFRYLRITSDGMRRWNLVLPFWLLACLFLILPIGWYYGRLRRRRLVRAGACLACGYDLRATPDRCPECGAVPATKGVGT